MSTIVLYIVGNLVCVAIGSSCITYLFGLRAGILTYLLLLPSMFSFFLSSNLFQQFRRLIEAILYLQLQFYLYLSSDFLKASVLSIESKVSKQEVEIFVVPPKDLDDIRVAMFSVLAISLIIFLQEVSLSQRFLVVVVISASTGSRRRRSKERYSENLTILSRTYYYSRRATTRSRASSECFYRIKLVARIGSYAKSKTSTSQKLQQVV